ncbi:hypothetical protein [Pseudomonas sp. 10-1B]|uniref:hypothetical protein n=1 Tax=Pseudomonas sp. 10-1B TaxID=1546029 RepID=UPI000A580C4D|nr:hypothetical protein [Pseudomonas sp. 10-1B]
MPVTSLRKTCVRPPEVAKIKIKIKIKIKSQIKIKIKSGSGSGGLASGAWTASRYARQ